MSPRRGIPHSAARTRKRMREFFTNLLLLGTALLMATSYASWVAHFRELRIAEIRVSGAKAMSPDALTAHVAAILARDYWGIFPKDNIALYPRGNIVDSLHRTFPVLSAIRVSLEKGRTLSVAVEERAPAYLWCSPGNSRAALLEDCFFIDANGYAFLAAPPLSPGLYVEFYGGGFTAVRSKEDSMTRYDPIVGGNVPELDAFILPPDEFVRARELSENLKERSLVPRAYRIEREGDARIELISGTALLYRLNAEPSAVIDNLLLALQSERIPGKDLTDQLAALEYVDLRFSNQVVFKYRR